MQFERFLQQVFFSVPISFKIVDQPSDLVQFSVLMPWVFFLLEEFSGKKILLNFAPFSYKSSRFLFFNFLIRYYSWAEFLQFFQLFFDLTSTKSINLDIKSCVI